MRFVERWSGADLVQTIRLGRRHRGVARQPELIVDAFHHLPLMKGGELPMGPGDRRIAGLLGAPSHFLGARFMIIPIRRTRHITPHHPLMARVVTEIKSRKNHINQYVRIFRGLTGVARNRLMEIELVEVAGVAKPLPVQDPKRLRR